jgi:hypothetical protein
MTQNLLTVKYDDFRMQIKLLKFPVLKQLIEGIYVYKRKYYPKVKDNTDIVHDLERKESIIWKELGDRGYDTKGADFMSWLKKMQNQSSKIQVVVK